MVGSTAFRSRFEDWDDFDLQIYTRSKPEWNSHYEILNDSGKHFLISAYYLQINPTVNPKPAVLDQKDVRVLFGSKESLKHIRVDRPRRIEPLPHTIPHFEAYHEVFFNILVDIFFILNRYEAHGRPFATKPRVARDGLRTICRHFYQFYGINQSISENARSRTLIKEMASILREKGYAESCKNNRFAKVAIDLMATGQMPAVNNGSIPA